MDLSLFEEKYNNDEKGADAYSPKALLKIIMYCYSTGIISSRPMEKACKTNITLKTLTEFRIVYTPGLFGKLLLGQPLVLRKTPSILNVNRHTYSYSTVIKSNVIIQRNNWKP